MLYITEALYKEHPYERCSIEKGFPCLISEVLPGQGDIDLLGVLRRIDPLGRDLPVFVEHINRYEDYKAAVAKVRALREQL